jgi:hypothetical protein
MGEYTLSMTQKRYLKMAKYCVPPLVLCASNACTCYVITKYPCYFVGVLCFNAFLTPNWLTVN